MGLMQKDFQAKIPLHPFEGQSLFCVVSMCGDSTNLSLKDIL